MTKLSRLFASSPAEKREEGVSLFALGCIGFISAFVALAELWSEWTGARVVHLATKPLIMASVAAYFLFSTRNLAPHKPSAKLRIQIIAGFGFSWLGDIALMFTEEASWVVLVGMGAFALAHVLYILAFRSGDEQNLSKQAQVHYIFALALLVYGGALYALLAPVVAPDIKIPIAGYAVILLSMAFAAFVRREYAAPGSFAWTFAGALAFVGSDSILSWHLFVSPDAALAVALMALYIFAQWAIAIGMSKEIRRAAHGKSFLAQ